MAAIIFDMDGTIADSFDYVSEFLARQAKAWPLTAEQKQALRGMSMSNMARHLGYGLWRQPVLFYKGRRRMQQAIKNVPVHPEMDELIKKLYDEGHELFIVSANSSRNIRDFLVHHNLNTYFVEWYGNVGVFGKAPALRRLLRQQKLDKKQAVYIGDELRDVQAAQSIDLKVVAVSWGFAARDDLVALRPTAVASTPKELLNILEEM